ncbi:hypothetical protein CPC08DRAFT_147330 [Agrocybe pediades]|nr:hypothetical protein CPC08DRAFT_147330 [Agrocybe pediades]
MMAKVYSNSMLVLLNSRMRIGVGAASDESRPSGSVSAGVGTSRRRTMTLTTFTGQGGGMSEGFTLTELGTTHSDNIEESNYGVRVEKEETEIRDPVPKAYLV